MSKDLEIKNADELVTAVKSAVLDKVTEIHSKYEAEVKANGKATSDTTESLKKVSAEFAELSEKNDSLGIELNELAQKLSAGFDSTGKKVKTVGKQIIDSDNFAEYQKGNINKMTLSVKNTILTESGSPQDPDHNLVQEDRLLGIVPLAFRSLNVLDIIPMGTTTSDTIKYGKESSFTNNATETAQGGAKTESVIEYTSQEDFVRTIPTFLKVSKQALDDAPMLESSINARLGHMIKHKAQQQILTGNGTSPNIAGLSATGNFTAFTPTSGDLATDSINKAKYAVIGADYEANVVIMNPADFGAIERLKTNGTDNSYAFGGGSALTYVNNGLQPLIWGLPVVLSNDVTSGKFYVMDRFACQLFMREALKIEIFEQDEDNVQKNLLTIRAEARMAFAVYANAPVRYGDLLV